MAVPQDIVKKIEEGFAKLQGAADCKSLLKKYLTKAVVDKLKVGRWSPVDGILRHVLE